MSKTKQQEARDDEQRAINQRIVAKVIKTLGQPPTLISVDVIRVGQHSYRVNVVTRGMTGLGSVSGTSGDIARILGRRIAHSFFVIEHAPNLDLESSPPITRIYK